MLKKMIFTPFESFVFISLINFHKFNIDLNMFLLLNDSYTP